MEKVEIEECIIDDSNLCGSCTFATETEFLGDESLQGMFVYCTQKAATKQIDDSCNFWERKSNSGE